MMSCYLWTSIASMSYLLYILFSRFTMTYLSLRDHARSTCTFCIIFIILSIYIIMRTVYDDPVMRLPTRLQKYLVYADLPDLNISVNVKNLKLKLEEINNSRNVSNLDKYMPMDADTPLLVVQVHGDIERLQHLVLSLALVRDIQTILLIFSHGFYDERIDLLVTSIDFCRVMQIYYPHSLQLNPDKFPGADIDACLPGLTEHKQHWWWKANFVFQRMEWAGAHGAPVIFLEENNYVAPDLLHMLQYGQRSFQYFPSVELMSFGRPLTRNIDVDLLVLEPWRPPFDVGLAFNKTTWNKILSFSAQYCMHDDNSWSYSLFNLFENFPSGHANMVACITPRVLSTKEFTDFKFMLRKFLVLFHTADLFPERVRAVYLFGRDGKVEPVFQPPPVGSGGWSDLRDQVLCLDPLLSTTTEEKRYYDAELN